MQNCISNTFFFRNIFKLSTSMKRWQEIIVSKVLEELGPVLDTFKPQLKAALIEILKLENLEKDVGTKLKHLLQTITDEALPDATSPVFRKLTETEITTLLRSVWTGIRWAKTPFFSKAFTRVTKLYFQRGAWAVHPQHHHYSLVIFSSPWAFPVVHLCRNRRFFKWQ
jgi:hypothetical protein